MVSIRLLPSILWYFTVSTQQSTCTHSSRNKHQGLCLHEQPELCTCLPLVASLICYSLKDSRLGYGYDERHHHLSTISMQQVTNRCSPMVVIWHNSEATGSTAWSKWPWIAIKLEFVAIGRHLSAWIAADFVKVRFFIAFWVVGNVVVMATCM